MEEEIRLIEALLAGQPSAAREFVDRYSGLVNWILSGEFGLYAHDRDDCFQEVFFRLAADAWRRVRQWQRTAPFAAYLSTIVRNVARDWFDANRRHFTNRMELDDEALNQIRDDVLQPDQFAFLSEWRKFLNECIEQLTEAGRNVIERRYLFGLDRSEIAAALGITENLVGVRICRAEESLKQCLRDRVGL